MEVKPEESDPTKTCLAIRQFVELLKEVTREAEPEKGSQLEQGGREPRHGSRLTADEKNLEAADGRWEDESNRVTKNRELEKDRVPELEVSEQIKKPSLSDQVRALRRFIRK